MKTELVERPKRHPNQVYDYDALLSTAESGLAIKVPLSGKSSNGVRATLDQWLHKHHPELRLHARAADEALLAWVEAKR